MTNGLFGAALGISICLTTLKKAARSTWGKNKEVCGTQGKGITLTDHSLNSVFNYNNHAFYFLFTMFPVYIVYKHITFVL